ncbi:hypothetical protein N7520_005864 [Penicillium odoratum]|uniref:uncharacterized protein n=1 Tax=Penicillium odoratum TaxID=1167516 RepID=UPI00254745DD|nr:uncharacterized protein N7520_005864 [Penicillium odoratum]KAJ5758708.1 hypothetical protein N7520_005864 [Penicillium odoratum]
MQRETEVIRMPPTEVQVQPVVDNGDLERIADIEAKAYGASSAMIQLMFPKSSAQSPETVRSSKISRHNRVWQSDSSVHYIKAVTYETSPDGAMSERIIGAAVYHIYESSHTIDERCPWPSRPEQVPEGANVPLCLHYFQTLTQARLDFTKGAPHAFLANLVVDPSFQRRGVGTKLLDFMIAEIAGSTDQAAMACWLDASPAGLKTYQRLGWEEVGATNFEMEQWGGAKGKSHKNVHMMKWISVSTS